MYNSYRIILGALLMGMYLSVATAKTKPLTVTSLRCLNRVNPINIDQKKILLSWKLNSAERSVLQVAYQLMVAEQLSDLTSEKATIWNSGKVAGQASMQVPYGGPELKSVKKYYWKVRIWDNKNHVSAWSSPALWQTALFNAADWKGAKWIGYDTLPVSKQIVPAIHRLGDTIAWAGKDKLPIIRKKFIVKKQIANATAFISGMGQFELSLNGKKIGDHFLDPGWTKYDKHAQYVTFDITRSIATGNNAIGIMLGNGFYYVPPERYRKLTGAYGYPKVICRIVINYSDGTQQNIITDHTWKAAQGPITFSSIYAGEDYNASFLQQGWDKSGFNDDKWRYAIETTGPPQLYAQLQEPLKIFNHFETQSVNLIKKGDWVYDMGQNASAIPAIKISGKKGTVVKFIPAELLNADGTANQSASGGPAYFEYTLKGNGVEYWHPRFSYYGYRYIQVEGAVPLGKPNPKKLPVVQNLESWHVRNAAAAAGTFNCSNKLFNKTDTLIKWAIKSNMVSVLTDCPHREKLGWLEQAHLMAPSVCYNYDISTLNQKIALDMAISQTPNGMVADIAPEYVHFGGGFRDSPEWGSASIIMPWYSYQWYGDEQILFENYPMMQKYIGYLRSKASSNILTHGLGDWFDIGPGKPGESQLTPKGITATATYYYDLQLMAKIATITHHNADAGNYTSLANEVKASFNKAYFNKSTKQYATGSQTANAIAVYMGLVDDTDKNAVIENLVKEIKARNNALTAGDIGYRYVLRVLEEAGCSDVIFDMNSRSDVPGYGWQLAHGATALTESWQAYGFVSNNHFMLGHLMEWFYSGLAGIRLAPDGIGFNQIEIHPSLVGDLTFAKASYQSPYGTIRSGWKKEKGVIKLDAEIPANTKAFIYVPNPENAPIMESGKPASASPGLQFIRFENGYSLFHSGSGKYSFLVKK